MEKTLRDEIAMTMPVDLLPRYEDEEHFLLFLKVLGFDTSCYNFEKDITEDSVKALNTSFRYQAMIRYMYADAMLQIRDKSINSEKLNRLEKEIDKVLDEYDREEK